MVRIDLKQNDNNYNLDELQTIDGNRKADPFQFQCRFITEIYKEAEQLDDDNSYLNKENFFNPEWALNTTTPHETDNLLFANLSASTQCNKFDDFERIKHNGSR